MIQLTSVFKKYVIKKGFFKRTIEEIPALTDVSLTIQDKECIGLIGLNGAGKSTLLKVVLGILKPDRGDALLFGKNAVDYREQNMKEIGVVFGQRSQLRWDVTPLDAYLLNKALYKIDEEEFDNLLNKYAELLDVKVFWDRPVRTLSLGQKMRADILASLLHKPKLLILDEPTIGLDVVSKRKIIDLIIKLKEEMTIIFTSHQLQDVYEVCDRFIVLNHGKILLDNNKEQVKEKIGYVTMNLTLSEKGLELEHLSSNTSIEKFNDYEYQIKDIPKHKLTEYVNILFSKNQIVHFEIKESDLESLLIEFGKEL
ncbi:ATP-binding cassette domain-containing protein [Streptobacillus moniliformis]|uniref:ATP-binding cassette domain-containing protein n=1 Tax=Streptobacillus moniliformis TaxID=34105 RepID=UPI0007E366E2|nr:ATP-binding cassette domain-containing protein [Streptobacillus moniliformis]QXW66009.1 ATP-binding cassette domain-containing protein [Streptobacillus moniliformis]